MFFLCVFIGASQQAFYAQDCVSRQLSRQSALRFDSPRTQNKVYYGGRINTLSYVFQERVTVEKIEDENEVLFEFSGLLFTPILGVNSGHFSYISAHPQFLNSFEDVELIKVSKDAPVCRLKESPTPKSTMNFPYYGEALSTWREHAWMLTKFKKAILLDEYLKPKLDSHKTEWDLSMSIILLIVHSFIKGYPLLKWLRSLFGDDCILKVTNDSDQSLQLITYDPDLELFDEMVSEVPLFWVIPQDKTPPNPVPFFFPSVFTQNGEACFLLSARTDPSLVSPGDTLYEVLKVKLPLERCVSLEQFEEGERTVMDILRMIYYDLKWLQE